MKKATIDLITRPENAFQYWCPIHEQQRFYSGCLFLVDAYRAGRITAKDPDSDCAKAMKAGDCAAQRMYVEEQDAGEALYFIDPKAPADGRTRQVSKDSVGYSMGWNKAGPAKESAPDSAATPVKKPRKKRASKKP